MCLHINYINLRPFNYKKRPISLTAPAPRLTYIIDILIILVRARI